MARIDSHHHFWRYSPAEYGWINDSLQALRRDFLPAHLAPEIQAVGIDQVVSVQARQSLSETDDLLDFADQNDWIAAVVGWVPLIDPDLDRILDRYSSRTKLKAVRHVLQDEPDPNYMLREDFQRGLRLLRPRNLVYDILIYERHLPQAIELVRAHPDQPFVLDHIAKPRIAAGEMSPWRELFRELARFENVVCKLSGMVTEADHRSWTESQLRPYFDVALEAFGPRRLMFGSDWPVCLAASSYQRWHDTVASWCAPLSSDERAAIFGETARAAYRLP